MKDRHHRVILFLLVGISLICGLPASADTDNATTDSFSPRGFGRIGIYETRLELVNELRNEMGNLNRELDRLRNSHSIRHPRVRAATEQLEILAVEIAQAQEDLSSAVDYLSNDDRSVIIERYRAELELATGRKRAELAGLRIRYKSKYPLVKQKMRELEALEKALTDFAASEIENQGANLNVLERIRLQKALYDEEARLSNLRLRYLDKHPYVIQAKEQITRIETALANSSQKLSPAPSITEAAETSLLREDIDLVGQQIALFERQVESGQRPQLDLGMARIELLELQAQLANLESGDASTYLDAQETILEELSEAAQDREEAIRLQRQIIDVKRKRLRLTH